MLTRLASWLFPIACPSHEDVKAALDLYVTRTLGPVVAPHTTDLYNARLCAYVDDRSLLTQDLLALRAFRLLERA